MAPRSIFPAIPDPQATLPSILATVQALKQTVTLLTVNAQATTAQNITKASQTFSQTGQVEAGLGSMAAQNSPDVTITGGSITATRGLSSVNPATAFVATADGAFITGQNSETAAADVYLPASAPGVFYSGVIRAVARMDAGTEAVCVSGLETYVLNDCAFGTGAGHAGVGLFGVGIVSEDGAHSWSTAMSLGDNTTNTAAVLSGRFLIGHEVDFTVCSLPGPNATVVEGLSFEMQGPGTPSAANAIQISSSSETARWVNGFITDNGAVTNGAIIIGSKDFSGTFIESASIFMTGWDGAGAEFAVELFSFNHSLILRDDTQACGFAVTLGSNTATLAPQNLANASLVLSSLGSGTVFASSPLVAGASFAATNAAVFEWNTSAIPPANLGMNFTMNQSGGLAEADLWNTFIGGAGFFFNQLTVSASAFINLLKLTPSVAAFGPPITTPQINVAGQATIGGVIQQPPTTVAALAALGFGAGQKGARWAVTDATGPTFLTTLVGGGAVVCPAFFNGANWVAG